MSCEQICSSLRRRALSGIRVLGLFSRCGRIVESSSLSFDW
jgi:hypothetical protein